MSKTKNHLPEYSLAEYKLNSQTLYYEIESKPIGFYLLPNELKVEETQRAEVINSRHIIRSRQKDKKYRFFTGLKKTRFKGWYYGDHLHSGKKSFILFLFAPANDRISIFYFKGYNVHPQRRNNFTQAVIQHLEQQKTGAGI